jgi:hypothetical protein
MAILYDLVIKLAKRGAGESHAGGHGYVPYHSSLFPL